MRKAIVFTKPNGDRTAVLASPGHTTYTALEKLLPKGVTSKVNTTEDKLNEAMGSAYQQQQAKAKANQLKHVCLSYQYNNGCDANMFAMLTSLKGLALMQGAELAVKAAACLQWVDDLWKDHDAREAKAIAGEAVSFDFSNNNKAPHSFSDVRAESGQ